MDVVDRVTHSERAAPVAVLRSGVVESGGMEDITDSEKVSRAAHSRLGTLRRARSLLSQSL